VHGALRVEWHSRVECVQSRLVAKAIVESALGGERLREREKALRVERGLVEKAVGESALGVARVQSALRGERGLVERAVGESALRVARVERGSGECALVGCYLYL